MNYRHAYHAGNFADVLKHVVLCRVLAHLREKPGAFRVIDTHAGTGRYELAGTEAGKTGEWRDGIARMIDATFEPPVRDLLAPYLDAVAAYNPRGGISVYPGSPLIALQLLRRQDRLIACELEPGAAVALARNLKGDARAKAIAIDGWTALSAYVPPTERRGLVLVDPPFEREDDLARLVQALETAHRKWATGIYLLWYPIKEVAEITAFTRRLARTGIPKILRVELVVAPGSDATRLRGSGLIVVNPPWTLREELKRLLPALAERLGGREKATTTLDWLAGETVM